MSTEIRISNYQVSEDTDLRSLEFSLGNQKVTTPPRSLNTNTFFRETKILPTLSCLNEIYHRFDAESLKKIDEVTAVSKKKDKEAEKSKVQAGNKPTLCILEFKNKDASPRYPTQHEIEILINTAYAYSDITPIPSVPRIARDLSVENFGSFIEYLNNCYEKIMVRNKKPILGYIPAAAPQIARKIIDFYIDHGINAYYFDLDAELISSHKTQLTAMKNQLAKRGYEENNFLHYMNISFGKSINDQKVLSARDLVGYGYGLDSMGGVHASAKRPPEFYEWLKKQKDVMRNTNRLLNREDYGYYRVDTLGAGVVAMIPKDAPIQRSDITSSAESRQTRAVKIVNLYQQCVESTVLRTIVNENPDKTLPYFRSKSKILETDLKNLIRSGHS